MYRFLHVTIWADLAFYGFSYTTVGVGPARSRIPTVGVGPARSRIPTLVQICTTVQLSR